MTPTQRTLAELKKRGYYAAVVEKWIPAKGGGFRKDLFGIIDVIALHGDMTIGIQVAGTNFSSHVKKILDAQEAVSAWLGGASRRLEIWGWRPLKQGKKRVWKLRRGFFCMNSHSQIEFYESEQL